MPLRSRYPRASHTFSRLVGAGGLCYSTSLATGFQPSNPRKMKPLAVVVTASNFHSTVTTRRDLPARIATSSCEDWCVVYQKVRLSRKGVNSSVANQRLIRHDPLTSPIGLPDHLVVRGLPNPRAASPEKRRPRQFLSSLYPYRDNHRQSAAVAAFRVPPPPGSWSPLFRL